MSLVAALRKKKRYAANSEQLHKYVYLTDGQVWLRAVKSGAEPTAVSEMMDKIYTRYKDVNERYWQTLKWVAVIWAAAAMSVMGLLEKASIFGIELTASKFGIFFLPCYALISGYNNCLAIKRITYISLFDAYYEAIEKDKKANVILDYPDAFAFFRFRMSHDIVPYPLHANLRVLPLIILVIAMVIFVPLIILSSTYVIYTISEQVWHIKSDNSILLKLMVVASVSRLLFSFIFPAVSFGKRRYQNLSLIYLLNRLTNSDGPRYSKLVQRYNAVRDAMIANGEIT